MFLGASWVGTEGLALLDLTPVLAGTVMYVLGGAGAGREWNRSEDGTFWGSRKEENGNWVQDGV